MRTITVLIALFCAVLPTSAQSRVSMTPEVSSESGTSLAELARAEAARRHAIEQPGRVYTNADLPQLPAVKVAPLSPYERAYKAIYEPYLHRLEERERDNYARYEQPIPHDRYWPFDGPPTLSPASAAIDRVWTDPWLAFQLQHPIEAAYGFSFSRSVSRPERIIPPAPLPIMTWPSDPQPSMQTSGMGAGVLVRRGLSRDP